MNNSLPSVVTMKNVSKSYENGLIRAVDDVSMSLEKGKIYALMGPSGCGKSTLLSMIGTLDEPTSGSIVYEGVPNAQDVKCPEFRRDTLGFVFQFHFLIPVLSVLENVECAMLSRKDLTGRQRRQKALYLLEGMGLGHRIDARANTISGGERQRVAIARALANTPQLILADEPTGSVDTITAKMILDILKQHAKAHGATMLIATHDREVASIADEIIRMQDGRIIVSKEIV